MANAPTRPIAARLRHRYDEVASTPAIGASGVLEELSKLASACVDGTSAAQDAVAFTFSTVLRLHSADRDEMPITGDDSYHLMAMAGECFADAVAFIESGNNAETALRIVAELARLTPDRFYNRWP